MNSEAACIVGIAVTYCEPVETSVGDFRILFALSDKIAELPRLIIMREITTIPRREYDESGGYPG